MSIKFSKEQLLAIYSKGQNIIVSAGAGSGKTAVLTKRITEILKSGQNASKLLVLTFTKAAASEMKERVIAAMNKDEKLKDRVSEVDNAYITTFDSFSNSIVNKYHDRLNLSNITVVEKSIIGVVKRKIINEIFLKYYESGNENFTSLIYDLTVKSDIALKENLIAVAEKLDLKTDRDEYIDTYIANHFNDLFFTGLLKEYEELLIKKINYLKDMILSVADELSSEEYLNINNSLSALFEAKNYNDIRSIIPLIKLPSIPEPSENVKLTLEQASSLLSEIKKDAVFTHVEDMKESFFSTTSYVSIIIDILKEYFEKLTKFKNEHEAFEFIDIAKMAIKLVKENSDIQEELKNSFYEILLDEYQDTSDIQEEFISYISNNNVYMVGDVKQSIYAFRNANPIIFKEKYDRYDKICSLDQKLSSTGGKIDLNQNFRSNRKVLNCVNDIFNHIMDDDIGQANFSKEHQMRFGFTKYDQISNDNKIKFVVYQNDNGKNENMDIDMFYVIKDIQEKIKNKEIIYDAKEDKFRKCTYKDFAILMSDGKTFEKTSLLLSYYNIPNAIYKNVDISNGLIFPLIKNIINLISLEYKKEHSNEYFISFYAVGRSFLVQYDDEYLFDLISARKYKESSLFKTIKELSFLADQISLKEMLELIYEKFDIYEKLINVGNIEENITALEYLVNMVSSMDKINLSIFEFVKYIDDIIENEDSLEYSSADIKENKVKIMTIHKSKGLEFPIVYFIKNFKQFYDSELTSKIFYNKKYGLITPFYIQGEGKTVAGLLAKESNKLSLISEKIRLLYVALTRAREQIVVLTSEKKAFPSISIFDEMVNGFYRRKYNGFSSIYNSVLNLFSDNLVMLDPESLSISDDYLKSKQIDYTNYISPETKDIKHVFLDTDKSVINKLHASKSQATLLSKEEQEKIKAGTSIHALFESIDFVNPDLSQLNKKERNYITSFLSIDILSDINKAKIYKEFEFIDNFEGKSIHGIIDLILEYDDHIDIIDYKLYHIEDEAYINQLLTYKKYISKKKKKPVNLYLYSIILNQYKKIGG